MKLVPATVSFDANGTPFSSLYGDVYHGAQSGPGQARHVFVAGNNLPVNWAGKPQFTVVETGFGLGINFLALWQAWRSDPARPARLHFVSIEKHPLEQAGMVQVHRRYAEFKALSAQLTAAWPLLVPGTHRLHFEHGRVTLTLLFADVTEALANMRLGADAFFLDGFAPRCNADMWSVAVMKRLARLARPQATLATYTAARAVRDALSEAGFTVERHPGFGGKRHMLSARYAPRWQPRHTAPAIPQWPQRSAIVIGAGLAGAAVCERLTARGWRVDLLERHPRPAAEASGLHAAAFHPQLSRDDAFTTRFTRAAFLYSLRRWLALEAAGHVLAWQRCGVLKLARGDDEEERIRLAICELGYPPAFAQYAERKTASAHAGCDVVAGGAWFPHGGWMKPRNLITAQIARVNTCFGVEVARLKREGEHWQAIAADGNVIARAPVVVLANAGDATRLAPVAQSLQRSRGRLTYLPADRAPPLRAVLTGRGYLLPDVDGVAVTGTSYATDDGDSAATISDHADNVAQLANLLASAPVDLDFTALNGYTAYRHAAADRMPLVGAMPDMAAARLRAQGLRGAHARDLPRLRGLYGAFGYASRGVVWSALAGEAIASLIEGEPPPLEGELMDAIDPARFLLKRLRRGESW